jgi:hypothetical protein
LISRKTCVLSEYSHIVTPLTFSHLPSSLIGQ